MLSQFVKDHRLQNKITLRGLAGKIGIPHDALWRFENNKPICEKFWVAILKYVLNEDQKH